MSKWSDYYKDRVNNKKYEEVLSPLYTYLLLEKTTNFLR